MHVAKQESVEVLVDFGGFVSFGYEGCMQFTCHGDEILIPSARYVETVQLACDDTILAVTLLINGTIGSEKLTP